MKLSRFRVRSWQSQHLFNDSSPLLIDPLTQQFKFNCATYRTFAKPLLNPQERVTGLRFLALLFRPVVLDIPIVVSPKTRNPTLDEHRSFAGHCALASECECFPHG